MALHSQALKTATDGEMGRLTSSSVALMSHNRESCIYVQPEDPKLLLAASPLL